MVDSIENFIVQVLGDITLEQNTYIDISQKDIKIKSYNIETNEVEYQKIKKIIRKKDSETFKVSTQNNSVIVSKEHKFFIKLNKEPFYCSLKEIIKLKGDKYILSNNKEWEKILSVKKTPVKEAIYDLEVDNNHNLFTNNMLSHNSMGDVNVPTGGNGWKFYADMRFKVWKSNDKVNELNKTTLDVVKNKCAAPFGKAEFNILWGTGIDNMQEIYDMAVEKDFLKQTASWCSFKDLQGNDIKLQGSAKVKEWWCENVEEYEYIKNKVLND